MADRWRRAGGVAVTVAIAIAVGIVVVLAPPGMAGAEDFSSEQVRALAQRAATDPASLARLRNVDSVDGRPVDLRFALEGVDGDDLRARLRALAEGGPVAGPAGPPARDEARRILDGKKFQPAPALRPFRGVLRWLGDRLRPLGGPFTRLWDAVDASPWGRLALAVAAVAVAAGVSLLLVNRRSRGGVGRGRGGRDRAPAEDPHDLERAADAAEAAGDLERAVRLRFRAGLLRLDRAGAIRYRAALTTGDVVRTVPSADLRALAGAFDEIAYGGRPAAAADVQAARAGWPRVLAEAAR